jgi:alpha-tubulin suppressor-like RCC1 family protein
VTLRDRPEICVSKSITKDRFVDVACGFGHSLALTDTGRVYAWGINMKGQLGLGDIKPRYQPTEMELANGHTIAKIYASDNSSACITEFGALYTWGSAKHQRLMQDSQLSTITTPTVVSKVSGVMIESFSFARKQSMALIFTRLLKVRSLAGCKIYCIIIMICYV